MLDPSTNTNPLSEPQDGHQENDLGADGHPWQVDVNKKKRDANEVSKHTFYVSNSQMRLKLVARNEVSRYELIALSDVFSASNAPMDHCFGKGRGLFSFRWQQSF